MSVCESILSLSPYQGGKPISELQRELGLEHVVKLASNENPLGVGPKALEAMQSAASEAGRYPDGNGFELKQAISKYLSVSSEGITLGNGSNDILELIARAYVCQAKDEVIFSQYAFVVYPLVTQALGATAVVTPANDFGHDLDAMLASITDNTKLIFIANPNNPTGTLLTDSAIYDFLSKVPSSVVVVLDQAYIEYLDATDNATGWLVEFENLVITRTFSKAYGLAGLRVGDSISSPKNADYLRINDTVVYNFRYLLPKLPELGTIPGEYEFIFDTVNYNLYFYSGYNGEDIYLDRDEVSTIWHPNQYLLLVSNANQKKTALARFKNHFHPLKKIMYDKLPDWKINSRNKEQAFAIDFQIFTRC